MAMFNRSQFLARKREKLLNYSNYQYNFEDAEQASHCRRKRRTRRCYSQRGQSGK
jgi:hypothetical protein